MEKIKSTYVKNRSHVFEFKLGHFCAIVISLILVIASTIITIYISSNTKEIASKYEYTLTLTDTAIKSIIFQSIEEDLNKGVFSTSKIIIEKMKQVNFIKDVEIRRTETDELIHDYGKRRIANEDKDELSETIKIIGDYTAIIKTYKQDIQNDTYKELIGNLTKYIFQILFIIIILGVITGIVMSDIITQPLKKLSEAAKEIADGHFGTKIPETSFTEVNSLVTSYNEMGDQLRELYGSLEQKVQERTNELKEANHKLKETQAMMVHSEKMRSLGELVAGIAHEINNPVNFIHGNIMILQNYADDLFQIIDKYDEYSANLTDEQKEKIKKLKEDIDIEFLRGDIKDLIKSCIEGTQRTKNIVLDLKNFSRMEEMVLTQFDIPKEIDTTLNILNNKYKNRITVIKNYGQVPKIEAYGGQLNQVFMNILDNAQDAIKEQGTVTINVKMKDGDNSRVQIEFIDTGTGIPEENIKKVFEPFFTTKVVGKGTGLGMSISYRVIKDHNGTIDIDSKVGVGTKFTIVLPIEHIAKNNDSMEKIR